MPEFEVSIYFNPKCGTARNVLAMIRNAGIEPDIIEYLKTPPSREVIRQLSARAGVKLHEWLREKDTPYAELGLNNAELNDDELLDAIEQHPILLNRPIVVTPLGVRLCRPSELVLDLLPPQVGAFTKEDGEHVVDSTGQHVR